MGGIDEHRDARGPVSFLLGRLGLCGSYAGLCWLVLAAVLLALGVAADFLLGQRAIFSLAAHHRSRLTGLYMATWIGLTPPLPGLLGTPTGHASGGAPRGDRPSGLTAF